ncbi:helix-turn-helix transcriptional regulator [Streptomyces sp. HD]|uniref:helix-turn-helix transcriptional regulator n=1 Tax=Streptomyces sp. HD TaxID=3020892 RepID=UPI00232FC456|nr:helix-turn-helix transcriptional regulator [Streptomyces sp. HD]MDC0770558.1 helix-turn-helix transcriptional regulator [Streptomyces sp. HD]
MPAVPGHAPRWRDADPLGADARRVSVLQGRLRALGRDAPAADTAVTTCLVWVADTLVEIAIALGDPRSAGVLVGEATNVLAVVPHDGRDRLDPLIPVEHLTERERSVLIRLQEDVPLRQIGLDLFISHNTVKTHARAVYRKLGACSRNEALDRARQLRLL